MDTSEVRFDNVAPTGLYFKEILTEDEVHVQYYRKGSVASRMNYNNLNASCTVQAKYLHITGITPALSEGCYNTVIEATKVAHEHQVTVVFDPNIRRKLWSDEGYAKSVLLDIVAQSDIVLSRFEEGHGLSFLFVFFPPDISFVKSKQPLTLVVPPHSRKNSKMIKRKTIN